MSTTPKTNMSYELFTLIHDLFYILTIENFSFKKSVWL